MRGASLFAAVALVAVFAKSADVGDKHPTLMLARRYESQPLRAGNASDDCRGQDWGTAGDFDFYVFQQSWSAEFCFSHATYPGCVSPTSEMKTSLTIHGLWPNYNQPDAAGHDYPECCPSSYGPAIDPTVVNSLLAQFQEYWPSEQDPNPSPPYTASLWQHEWGKHGTCSGLAQSPYFQQAIATHLKLGTPSAIVNNIGRTVSRADVEAAYTGGSACVKGQSCMVGLGCSSKFLADVTTCWSKTGKQMECPWLVLQGSSSCLSQDTLSVTAYANTEGDKREVA